MSSFKAASQYYVRRRGLSVTVVKPAKPTEPIKMPFGLWSLLGPKKHVLDGIQIPYVNG